MSTGPLDLRRCVAEALGTAILVLLGAHFALLAQLFGDDLRERRDLPEGYAFRFDAGVLEAVARFVDNERR